MYFRYGKIYEILCLFVCLCIYSKTYASATVSKVDLPPPVYSRLFSFSGGTFLRGVQGNPNFFPILVQGDAVHGIGTN